MVVRVRKREKNSLVKFRMNKKINTNEVKAKRKKCMKDQ